MTDLITLQEYKDYNGITNPKDDVKLGFIIPSVSNLIKAYIGLPTGDSDTVVEALTVDYDTDTLFLGNWPVSGITSITEVDRYTTDSTIHVPLYHGADYQFYGDKIIRTPGALGFASWPIGPNTVIVTYTVGFENDEIPADLKLATIEMVKYYHKEEYVQSKTIQGSTIINSVVKTTDFPPHVQRILDNYK